MSEKKPSELGARIAQLREQNFVSQAYLAKKIGVSRSIIGKMENGDRKVSSDELASIASFFNVSTDYLLGRLNDNLVRESPLSKDDREVVSLFRRKTKGMNKEEKEEFTKSLKLIMDIARKSLENKL